MGPSACRNMRASASRRARVPAHSPLSTRARSQGPWYDARMDATRTLHPHLELGDICRIAVGVIATGSYAHEHSFGLVVGGVEGQVVDLLIEGRLIRLNRRWLEPLAREHVRPAGGVV